MDRPRLDLAHHSDGMMCRTSSGAGKAGIPWPALLEKLRNAQLERAVSLQLRGETARPPVQAVACTCMVQLSMGMYRGSGHLGWREEAMRSMMAWQPMKCECLCVYHDLHGALRCRQGAVRVCALCSTCAGSCMHALKHTGMRPRCPAPRRTAARRGVWTGPLPSSLPFSMRATTMSPQAHAQDALLSLPRYECSFVKSQSVRASHRALATCRRLRERSRAATGSTYRTTPPM